MVHLYNFIFSKHQKKISDYFDFLFVFQNKVLLFPLKFHAFVRVTLESTKQTTQKLCSHDLLLSLQALPCEVNLKD